MSSQLATTFAKMTTAYYMWPMIVKQKNGFLQMIISKSRVSPVCYRNLLKPNFRFKESFYRFLITTHTLQKSLQRGRVWLGLWVDMLNCMGSSTTRCPLPELRTKLGQLSSGTKRCIINSHRHWRLYYPSFPDHKACVTADFSHCAEDFRIDWRGLCVRCRMMGYKTNVVELKVKHKLILTKTESLLVCLYMFDNLFTAKRLDRQYNWNLE